MEKRIFNIVALYVILSLLSCDRNEKYQMQTDPSDYLITYEQSMPIGIVGDGQILFQVQSGTMKNKASRDNHYHSFRYVNDKQEISLDCENGRASFFPGGIIYSFTKEGLGFDVMHACLEDDPYICFVKVKDAPAKVISPEQFSLASKMLVDTNNGYTYYKFATKQSSLEFSWDELQQKSMERYLQEGLLLKSPSLVIDRSVAFSQFLLDMGYNDELIICELFRWRDIWSRDLGSGFGPGALYTNRIEEAQKCIQYDMNRYVKSTSKSLKTTDDASKGGSAEGTAWLTATLWDYYLITGDVEFLREGANDIRPFVEAWIDRDYDDKGLIIDVTEWMDHSRHQLLPYGGTTTYSNALMVQLLTTFSMIEQELGDESASVRYASFASRFKEGMNRDLWMEDVGAYANLQVNGIQDKRTASAANALAILAGVADHEKTAKIFKTLEEKNWMPAGSMTLTPRTTHIDSDQNEKIWPWWNAVEALARFKNNNSNGGLRLLENCAKSLEIDQYPGMMQEVLEKTGETHGGNTFVTGAGSFLTTIYKGLLGIEILEPGMGRLRIKPNMPDSWKTLEAKIPTPNGYFNIRLVDGEFFIRVYDPSIKVVEVDNGVNVVGAKSVSIQKNVEIKTKSIKKVVSPIIPKRKAVVFHENGIPFVNRNLEFEQIDIKELGNIDRANFEAIIFTTNSVPAYTQDGRSIIEILEEFVKRGGAVIFYGVTMKTLDGDYADKLGKQGGVIEWYSIDDNKWKPYNIKTKQFTKKPERGGTVYWGEGNYFNSWDVQQGLFGFSANGNDVSSKYKELHGKDIKVTEVFSNFAVSKPYYFESLAETYTEFNFMFPQVGEKFSCFCRIVNTETTGEFVLISKSFADQINTKDVSAVLKLY
jgi:hypothetical protein